MNPFDELGRIADDFPHPLVFATLSGSHLYGFPSPDSDFDLRGCHVLPAVQHLGLHPPTDETETRLAPDANIDLDLVSHDIGKFCRMLLQRNGYVLEQLASPLVIQSSDEHEALCGLVPRLVTKNHAHHYLGFARGQWQRLETKPTVKALLYVYRVLLTGIHLMRTGEVEANLNHLIAEYPTPDVTEWIEHKRSGAEFDPLEPTAVEAHRARYESLLATLEAARETSELPSATSAFEAVDAIVLATRLRTLRASDSESCEHR